MLESAIHVQQIRKRTSLPGIFQETIFTRRPHDTEALPSLFIDPIHPKTEVRPNPETITKVLNSGWVAQLKIHGHRAQIHLSSNPEDAILVYNRHGELHKKELSLVMESELRRLFTPQTGWNVIDAEWLKPEDRLYVFDFLKKDGLLLRKLCFLDRWNQLPRAYISPCIQTLGVITHLQECLDVFSKKGQNLVEGLVFKSPSPGFEDSSIIRCRIKS